MKLTILRILGNIVSGNALQTQKVLDCGALPYLQKTITHEMRSIRRETCWIISNIAAGTQQQLEALILSNFTALICDICKNDEYNVNKV